LPLRLPLELEVDAVLGGAGAEQEADEHADHQHRRDEDEVAARHDAAAFFTSPASRSISARSRRWRSHKSTRKTTVRIHTAAYAITTCFLLRSMREASSSCTSGRSEFLSSACQARSFSSSASQVARSSLRYGRGGSPAG